MFASTILNYMDRQTVSLLSDQIRASFAIREYVDFGWVISAFFMAYALFQVPAGFLVDRWDLRWSYAGAVAWWSLAAVATAIVPSLGWLIVCRAFLGVGESFNWPCALRVTSRVLPPRDRSLGNGIFNSGAAVGAVVTPLVVNNLTPHYGWRVTFLIIGSAGFVWVAAWLFFVRGERRGLLAYPHAKEPPAQEWRPMPAGLSRVAMVAFGAIVLAAVGARFLRVAIWTRGRFAGRRRGGDPGPACGRRPVARARVRGVRLGEEPASGRPAQPILDPGMRFDIDQHLLALFGELDPHRSQERASLERPARQLSDRRDFSGRRLRQCGRWVALTASGRSRDECGDGSQDRHGHLSPLRLSSAPR